MNAAITDIVFCTETVALGVFTVVAILAAADDDNNDDDDDDVEFVSDRCWRRALNDVTIT